MQSCPYLQHGLVCPICGKPNEQEAPHPGIEIVGNEEPISKVIPFSQTITSELLAKRAHAARIRSQQSPLALSHQPPPTHRHRASLILHEPTGRQGKVGSQVPGSGDEAGGTSGAAAGVRRPPPPAPPATALHRHTAPS